MDAISVALIVTVLSVGTILLYLFNADYELRQKSINQTVERTTSNKKGNSKHRQDAARVQSSSTSRVSTANQPRQVPSVEASPATTQVQIQSNQPPKIISKQTLGKSSSIGHNNGGNSKSPKNQKLKQVHVAQVTQPEMSMEPSKDELDSSILLGVFNPTQNNHKQPITQRHPQNELSEKKAPRKRQAASEFAYSSENFFNLIAASNLSKDEIELAVEALLNKIESGQSDWKQPKSDPLRRLKNQLRDHELALTTEIQNHEQTRLRLNELKNLLQSEKSSNNSMKEALGKLNTEIGVINLALEQTRNELAKQQMLNKQLNEDSAQVIAKLEQDKVAQSHAVLADNSSKEAEVLKLRNELDDKMGQLQRYELSSQTMSERLHELESKLRSTEIQLDQIRSSKQQDDYEACAKIAELESVRMQLDKVLKDQATRLKEITETNSLLEKSVKELQVINGRQEDLLKRLRDERLVNEASMKRTLCEMEQELKELQSKLSANSASHDERLRKEITQVERELTSADQREQKLMSEMKELREGLSALLPDDIKRNESSIKGDWVQQYLAAVKQLAKTVEELSEPNNNNVNDSPSKKSVVDKSTLTLRTNGVSSRVGSPTNNGRASKAGSYQHHDSDKKVAETKLLELNDYVAELEADIQRMEEANQDKVKLSE